MSYDLTDFMEREVTDQILEESEKTGMPYPMIIVEIVRAHYLGVAQVESSNDVSHEDEVIEVEEPEGDLASFASEEDVISADEPGDVHGREEEEEEVDPTTLSHPIDDHGLSNRSRNALVRNGVLTFEDLQKFGDEEIYALDGVGRKSGDEIVELARSQDPTFDDDHPSDESDPELAFYHSKLSEALGEDEFDMRVKAAMEMMAARMDACANDEEKDAIKHRVKMDISRSRMVEDEEIEKLFHILVESLPIRTSQVSEVISLGSKLGYDAGECRESVPATWFDGKTLKMLNVTEASELISLLENEVDKISEDVTEGYDEPDEGDDFFS